MATKTHSASIGASIAQAFEQNHGAVLPAAMDPVGEVLKKEKRTAAPRKENRSTTGVPVGAPILDIEDAAAKRDTAEAAKLTADIIVTAREEGGRWKKHYMALMQATAAVRAKVLVMLNDNQKAYNDKLKAAGENHLTRTLSNSAYVRISELKTFIKALNKGLTKDVVGEMLIVGGKPMEVEEAQSTQLVAVARQFISGNGPAVRPPAMERLSPEDQLKLAILRAVARRELKPSILTHRWMANHATKVIDDWTKAGVLKELTADNAPKIAAVINADPSAKKTPAKKVA